MLSIDREILYDRRSCPQTIFQLFGLKMDPIRYGFIRTIIDVMENFVNQLPPLLQLLLGVFLTIGLMKLLIMIADFFDKKREQNK